MSLGQPFYRRIGPRITFDHLVVFNVPANLDIRAFSLFAYIGKAATRVTWTPPRRVAGLSGGSQNTVVAPVRVSATTSLMYVVLYLCVQIAVTANHELDCIP